MSRAEIRFDDTPTGTPMRGFENGAGPAMELVEIRHEMPDGTFAVETVWRTIEPAPPAPAPEAPPAAVPDGAAQGETSADG